MNLTNRLRDNDALVANCESLRGFAGFARPDALHDLGTNPFVDSDFVDLSDVAVNDLQAKREDERSKAKIIKIWFQSNLNL